MQTNSDGPPPQGPRIGVVLNSSGLLVQEEVRLIGRIEWRGVAGLEVDMVKS